MSMRLVDVRSADDARLRPTRVLSSKAHRPRLPDRAQGAGTDNRRHCHGAGFKSPDAADICRRLTISPARLMPYPAFSTPSDAYDSRTPIARRFARTGRASPLDKAPKARGMPFFSPGSKSPSAIRRCNSPLRRRMSFVERPPAFEERADAAAAGRNRTAILSSPGRGKAAALHGANARSVRDAHGQSSSMPPRPRAHRGLRNGVSMPHL